MMNCPFCNTENPTMARFCMQCGQPLTRCSHCQTALPKQANYCYHCGLAQPKTEDQTPVTTRRRSASGLLQQYMSPEYAAKLEAATQATRDIKSERRVVTILFCDVKGSTAMAEKLDPEEWSEVMNGAFEYLIEPIYRYEGTVVRLLGDAVLAFFGAPISHEDDPQRAVLAALAMAEGIEQYRQQMHRERGLDFDIRVGINTGLVVVGEIGSDLRAEYTVMGDAVNLAARMEQTARPGTVQVSGYTYKLIAPLFEFEPLGSIEVKGKAQPIPAYQVLRPHPKPGRLRGIDGLNAPLIGRTTELSTLEHLLHAVDEGQGQIICLTGEAGLGKSRLARELKEACRDDHLSHILWSESRALSFETSRPYAQFQQHIRNFFGVTEQDSNEIIHQKIIEPLKKQRPEKYGTTGHVLETLLGITPTSTNGHTPNIEGENFKRELFSLVKEGIKERAKRQPTVMVFEDLHWADHASVELLHYILPLVAEVPLMLLCVLRPDTQAPSWGVPQMAQKKWASRYTEINLTPLSATDSSALVDHLLVIANLPDSLRTLIETKADGNPFFLEEVVRTLLDDGVIKRTEDGLHWFATHEVTDIAIPDNLQSLLIARIDHLPEAVQQTVQQAAVIGRIFSHRVLSEISDTPNELAEHLLTLMELSLIRQTTVGTDAAYIFHHVLTQEAAYQMILLKERRHLHQKVGLALEHLFTDRVDEYAPVLGHHFYEGGDQQRAFQYYRIAGDVAYRLYAKDEAITHYERAIEMQSTATDLHQMKEVLLRLGRAYELSSNYERAIESYQQLEALGQTTGHQAVELAALVAQGTIRATFTSVLDVALAEELCSRSLALARLLHDQAAEAKVLWNLMLLERSKQNPKNGIQYGEQSLSLARELQLPEEMAYALNDLQYLYLATGQLEKAYETMVEGQALWRQLDNLPMLSDSLGNSILLYYSLGNYHTANEVSAEAFELSQSIDNSWGKIFSRLVMPNIYHDWGHIDEAVTTAQYLLTHLDENILVFARSSILIELAWVYLNMGQTDKGVEYARQNQQETTDTAAYQAGSFILLARVALHNGTLEQADFYIQQAISALIPEPITSFLPHLAWVTAAQIAIVRQDYQTAQAILDKRLITYQRVNLRPYLDDVWLAQAQLYEAQEEYLAAEQFISEIYPRMQALPCRRVAWQMLALWHKIALAQGQVERAESLRQEGWEIIQYIVAHTSDPAMRASFLQRAEVQALKPTMAIPA